MNDQLNNADGLESFGDLPIVLSEDFQTPYYQLGDLVYALDDTGCFLVKVLDISNRGGQLFYKIHYCGYNDKYDDWKREDLLHLESHIYECAADGCQSEDEDIICCDYCPRTFHQACAGLAEVPMGLWRCPVCDYNLSREIKLEGNTKDLPATKKCELILGELWKHDFAVTFAEPVDVDEAPNYSKIIQSPMDLGTVRRNLEAGKYNNALPDFVRDVRQVWFNCKTYNLPRSAIARSSDELSWIFEMLIERELIPDLDESARKKMQMNWEMQADAQRKMVTKIMNSNPDLWTQHLSARDSQGRAVPMDSSGAGKNGSERSSKNLTGRGSSTAGNEDSRKVETWASSTSVMQGLKRLLDTVRKMKAVSARVHRARQINRLSTQVEDILWKASSAQLADVKDLFLKFGWEVTHTKAQEAAGIRIDDEKTKQMSSKSGQSSATKAPSSEADLMCGIKVEPDEEGAIRADVQTVMRSMINQIEELIEKVGGNQVLQQKNVELSAGTAEYVVSETLNREKRGRDDSEEYSGEDMDAAEEEDENELIEEIAKMRCPQNHALISFTVSGNGGWNCDSCGKEDCGEGSSMFGCATCSYDVCEQCAGQHSQGLEKTEQVGEAAAQSINKEKITDEGMGVAEKVKPREISRMSDQLQDGLSKFFDLNQNLSSYGFCAPKEVKLDELHRAIDKFITERKPIVKSTKRKRCQETEAISSDSSDESRPTSPIREPPRSRGRSSSTQKKSQDTQQDYAGPFKRSCSSRPVEPDKKKWAVDHLPRHILKVSAASATPRACGELFRKAQGLISQIAQWGLGASHLLAKGQGNWPSFSSIGNVARDISLRVSGEAICNDSKWTAMPVTVLAGPCLPTTCRLLNCLFLATAPRLQDYARLCADRNVTHPHELDAALFLKARGELRKFQSFELCRDDEASIRREMKDEMSSHGACIGSFPIGRNSYRAFVLPEVSPRWPITLEVRFSAGPCHLLLCYHTVAWAEHASLQTEVFEEYFKTPKNGCKPSHCSKESKLCERIRVLLSDNYWLKSPRSKWKEGVTRILGRQQIFYGRGVDLHADRVFLRDSLRHVLSIDLHQAALDRVVLFLPCGFLQASGPLRLLPNFSEMVTDQPEKRDPGFEAVIRDAFLRAGNILVVLPEIKAKKSNKNEGSPTPQDVIIGQTKIQKHFPSYGVFTGTVVALKSKYYQILYEDDDSEDMLWEELKPYLKKEEASAEKTVDAKLDDDTVLNSKLTDDVSASRLPTSLVEHLVQYSSVLDEICSFSVVLLEEPPLDLGSILGEEASKQEGSQKSSDTSSFCKQIQEQCSNLFKGVEKFQDPQVFEFSGPLFTSALLHPDNTRDRIREFLDPEWVQISQPTPTENVELVFELYRKILFQSGGPRLIHILEANGLKACHKELQSLKAKLLAMCQSFQNLCQTQIVRQINKQDNELLSKIAVLEKPPSFYADVNNLIISAVDDYSKEIHSLVEQFFKSQTFEQKLSAVRNEWGVKSGINGSKGFNTPRYILDALDDDCKGLWIQRTERKDQACKQIQNGEMFEFFKTDVAELLLVFLMDLQKQLKEKVKELTESISKAICKSCAEPLGISEQIILNTFIPEINFIASNLYQLDSQSFASLIQDDFMEYILEESLKKCFHGHVQNICMFLKERKGSAKELSENIIKEALSCNGHWELVKTFTTDAMKQVANQVWNSCHQASLMISSEFQPVTPSIKALLQDCQDFIHLVFSKDSKIFEQLDLQHTALENILRELNALLSEIDSSLKSKNVSPATENACLEPLVATVSKARCINQFGCRVFRTLWYCQRELDPRIWSVGLVSWNLQKQMDFLKEEDFIWINSSQHFTFKLTLDSFGLVEGLSKKHQEDPVSSLLCALSRQLWGEYSDELIFQLRLLVVGKGPDCIFPQTALKMSDWSKEYRKYFLVMYKFSLMFSVGIYVWIPGKYKYRVFRIGLIDKNIFHVALLKMKPVEEGRATFRFLSLETLEIRRNCSIPKDVNYTILSSDKPLHQHLSCPGWTKVLITGQEIEQVLLLLHKVAYPIRTSKCHLCQEFHPIASFFLPQVVYQSVTNKSIQTHERKILNKDNVLVSDAPEQKDIDNIALVFNVIGKHNSSKLLLFFQTLDSDCSIRRSIKDLGSNSWYERTSFWLDSVCQRQISIQNTSFAYMSMLCTIFPSLFQHIINGEKCNCQKNKKETNCTSIGSNCILAVDEIMKNGSKQKIYCMACTSINQLTHLISDDHTTNFIDL